jgi:uracil-DNA glycosylase
MASLFSQHAAKWKNCTDCPLCKTRTKVVLARGKVPCDVLFVGEAPGASEDVIGQPFIGPAGKLLDQIIDKAMGDSRYTYAMTNLIACIPLGDDGNKVAEPTEDSIRACYNRLIEFVDICHPQLIVLVGTLATKYGPGGGELVISIIHPAAILRMDISQKGLAIQRCIVAINEAVAEIVPF